MAKAIPERPAADADVRVTPSDGKMLVQWRSFRGAVGYRLTGSPGDIAIELSDNTPYFLVEGLENGTEYTFEVIVLRAQGEEASVGSASATPGVWPVVQIAADSSNMCALRESGEVLCWGSNADRQLGDGFNGVQRSVPGLMADVSDAVEIGVGGYGSCARLKSGAVWCWGNDSNLTPTLLAGIDDAVQLVVRSHACARRATGEVLCWGAGLKGQLGDGTTSSRKTPAPVQGLSDAVEVAAGGEHTCAVRQGGEIVCWGANDLGQLGDGTAMARTAPTAVKGLVGAVELSAGQKHTCARRENGEVYCWGSNNTGQLGVGDTSDRKMPMLVRNLTDAVQITAGINHTCARKADGSVACWGQALYGQGGNNVTDFPRSTLAVVAGVTDAVEVRAGGFHTCARRANGEVLCWGANDDGQLGDGTRAPLSYPMRVAGVSDVAQVAVSSHHSCARHTSGEVSCWGSNEKGQLGDGTMLSRYTPAKATGVANAAQLVAGEGFNCVLSTSGEVTCWGGSSPVTGLMDVAELSASDFHTCARRKSGEVLCWGRNEYGQLGDGTMTMRTAPTPVKGLSDAAAIAAGNGHTCAKRATGQVVCWGQGGRIGDGTTTQRLEPTGVSGLRDAVLLRAGSYQTCATDSAGAVLCWGVVPTPIEGLSGIVELTVDDNMCVIRADGGVLCWGSAGSGQLGDGEVWTGEAQKGPIRTVRGPLDVVQVALGTWHGCAVRADHTLDCWGGNDYGQIGRSRSTTPRAVIGL